nr:MAG TPA: hypothetical protein [Caudoviricetes sp.]
MFLICNYNITDRIVNQYKILSNLILILLTSLFKVFIISINSLISFLTSFTQF